MSLVFAGLLVDFVPMITGRPLSTAKNVSLDLLGHDTRRVRACTGSVAGRQLTSHRFRFDLAFELNDLVDGVDDPGLQSKRKTRQPGCMAFGLLLQLDYRPDPGRAIYFARIPCRGPIESTAPQALIYGWVLQFGIALIPYIARRFFLKEENPQLGGCWGSLAAATLGSLFVWASIFIVLAGGALYGIGFGLYALALISPRQGTL